MNTTQEISKFHSLFQRKIMLTEMINALTEEKAEVDNLLIQMIEKNEALKTLEYQNYKLSYSQGRKTIKINNSTENELKEFIVKNKVETFFTKLSISETSFKALIKAQCDNERVLKAKEIIHEIENKYISYEIGKPSLSIKEQKPKIEEQNNDSSKTETSFGASQ